MKFNSLILWLFVALFAGCRNGSLEKDQRSVHISIQAYVDGAFQSTHDRIHKWTQMLRRNLADKINRNQCKKIRRQNMQSVIAQDTRKDALSSVYIPRSAHLSTRSDCFLEASQDLENEWNSFYQKEGYVSWIYAYDGVAKVKRILPIANTQTLFGDDLSFDKFSFYVDAAANYPKPTWTRVKEDINGTGRIVIGTEAFKVDEKDKDFVVVCADIRMESLSKRHLRDLHTFAQEYRLHHLFMYSYTIEGNRRRLVSDFTTNLALWSQIKPIDQHFLNIQSAQDAAIVAMEQDLQKKGARVVSKKVGLNQSEYFCSLSKSENLNIFTLICSLEG